MSTKISDDKLLLQNVYKNEKARADALYLTQPLNDGTLDTYSWARFMDETRRIATYLQAQNLPPKSHIALLSKNCAHFLMTDLAIWMAGHVSVALYPTLNAETVTYILDHSDAKLLFVGKLDTWDEMKAGVPDDMPMVSFPLAPVNDYPTWNTIIKDNEPLAGNPIRPADDIALIMYTSGSTGRPKGVMHSFASISAATHILIRAVNVTTDDRILSYLPLAHSMERWIVGTTSMMVGYQVYFAKSLATFVEDLQRARPTLFVSVPRLWYKFQAGVLKKMPQKRLNLLLKIPVINKLVRTKVLTALGLQHVRVAGSGSAPIAGELLQWYRDLGLELREGYGMSENFNCSHMTVPGHARVGYVGEPYPGVECKLSDEDEILVKSPGTMVGYYKQPEETAEVMAEDGFLHTGDRGEIDTMGRLKITGRTKELFKSSKGKYIAPAPIENMLNNSPRIELSCVSGSGRAKAYAVVMLAEELYSKLDASLRSKINTELKELFTDVNSKVENFEQLQFIAVAKEPWTIEDQLLTPTQKIKRANIEDRFAPKLDNWYDAKKSVIWDD